MGVPFSFRVKIGKNEVEISGERDAVLKIIEELPRLMETVSEALKTIESEDLAEAPKSSSVKVPEVSASSCSEAIIQLLSSDWGKQPRTLAELGEALKTNAVYFPSTTISSVLSWLVRKNKIKRWKTDKGYVYVLASGERRNGKS